jgi:hypothetical protein
MSTLAQRLLGSACLNSQSYEEVEADRQANSQAIAIVLVSSLAASIGAGIKSPKDTVILMVFSVVSWIALVLLTLLIGTRLLSKPETRSNFGEIFRTTAFSSTPGIFRIFGLVPVIGWYLFIAATLWILVAFIIAIRQALDFDSTGRALAVSLLGWLIYTLLFFGFVMTTS